MLLNSDSAINSNGAGRRPAVRKAKAGEKKEIANFKISNFRSKQVRWQGTGSMKGENLHPLPEAQKMRHPAP